MPAFPVVPGASPSFESLVDVQDKIAAKLSFLSCDDTFEDEEEQAQCRSLERSSSSTRRYSAPGLLHKIERGEKSSMHTTDAWATMATLKAVKRFKNPLSGASGRSASAADTFGLSRDVRAAEFGTAVAASKSFPVLSPATPVKNPISRSKSLLPAAGAGAKAVPRSPFMANRKNIDLAFWLADFYQAVMVQHLDGKPAAEAIERAAESIGMNGFTAEACKSFFFSGHESVIPYRALLHRMFPDARKADVQELFLLAFPKAPKVEIDGTMSEIDRNKIEAVFSMHESETGGVSLSGLGVVLTSLGFPQIQHPKIIEFAARGCPFSGDGEISMMYFLKVMEQYNAWRCSNVRTVAPPPPAEWAT